MTYHYVPIADFIHWLARGWSLDVNNRLIDPRADMGHHGHWSVIMRGPDAD